MIVAFVIKLGMDGNGDGGDRCWEGGRGCSNGWVDRGNIEARVKTSGECEMLRLIDLMRCTITLIVIQ